jgi:hypothetical protein
MQRFENIDTNLVFNKSVSNDQVEIKTDAIDEFTKTCYSLFIIKQQMSSKLEHIVNKKITTVYLNFLFKVLPHQLCYPWFHRRFEIRRRHIKILYTFVEKSGRRRKKSCRRLMLLEKRSKTIDEKLANKRELTKLVPTGADSLTFGDHFQLVIVVRYLIQILSAGIRYD